MAHAIIHESAGRRRDDAAAVTTLVAAIIGGKQGEHYHNKIDAAGQVDTVNP